MRALISLGLAFIVSLSGQGPQPPGPPPIFRAGTRLVQVNVIVHDKHGEPVPDLKKEDFVLVERGKPQQIRFFSMDTAGTGASTADALPPHIFTNALPAQRGVPTSVTVILIDGLNTAWGDQQRARDGILKFTKQIEPQDR